MRAQSEPTPDPSGRRPWQAVTFKGSGRPLPQMASVRLQEGYPGKMIQDFSQERVPKELPELPYFSVSQVSLYHFP